MNTNIKIRRANLQDFEKIQKLFVETIHEVCIEDYNEAQIAVWATSINNKDKWEKFIVEEYFLVAEDHNKIVGFISLDNDDYVNLLYVHKNFQRRGVASILYDAIKLEAGRMGIDKLSADVSKTAVPFFHSKSFKVVKENRSLMNEVEIVNFTMVQ